MTPLRAQMIRDLTIRGLSPRTQHLYLRAVYWLAKHYRRCPSKISDEEIHAYLYELINVRKLAPSTLNVIASGLRFFHSVTLKRQPAECLLSIPRVKRALHRPRVYSEEEVERLFNACGNLKHQTFLMTVYGAGLRVSEAVHLRPADIESSRMLIRVEQGKGNKDRYTILTPRLLNGLREYWRAFRPNGWLFNGAHPGTALSTTSAREIFYRAVQKAGLPDRGGIHSLRHSFATHLVESGVELPVIQRLLGHSSLVSTSVYLHVQSQRLARLASPLEKMNVVAPASKHAQ